MAKDVNIVPIKALCYNPQNPSQYSTEEFKLAFEYVLQVHPQNAAMAVVNLSGLNNDDNNHCLFDPVDPNCDYYDQLREAVVSVARRNNLLLVQASGNKTTSPNQPEIDACSRSFGDESRYSNAEHPSGISDSAAIARIIIAAGSDENDGRLRILSGEPGAPIESTIGDCVDIFAPATHIASAFFPLDPGTFDPDEAVCQLSGTSMAAPHVSGVAAMFLQDSPNPTPEELRGMILARGVHDVLESNFGDPNYIGDGSPNLLLHWDPNVFRDGFETGNFVAWSSYLP